MEFKYDGGGLAKGGDVTLYYDGKPCRQRSRRTHPADGLLPRTRPATLAPTPAHPRHRTTARPATGSPVEIDWVQIDIGDDSHDHLIKAEDRLTVAMARQ